MDEQSVTLHALAGSYLTLKETFDQPIEVRAAALRAAAATLDAEIARQAQVAVHAYILNNMGRH